VKGSSNEGGGPKCKGKDDDKKDSNKAAAAMTKEAKEKEPNIEAWAIIDNTESNNAALTVPVMVVKYSAKAECKLFDSRASHHMFLHCKQFITYETISACPITAVNNQVLHAIGMENLQIELPNGGKSTKVLLKDVLHVPDLALTVVLVGHIMKAEYNVEFNEDAQECCIHKKKMGPIIG
jgi:Pol polyprotein